MYPYKHCGHLGQIPSAHKYNHSADCQYMNGTRLIFCKPHFGHVDLLEKKNDMTALW